VEAAAARRIQRAVNQGQEDQGQGGGPSQGGRAVPAHRLAPDGAGVAQKNLSCSDARELRKLVDHAHPELSVSRQCALLGLPRSMLYYQPTPVRKSTLQIMARIDVHHLEDPCSGSLWMVGYLARDGISISRDRVRNLMRRVGFRAIYRKPRTTLPGDPSERFPCLVDVKGITAVDQVWATDITYIPLRKGSLFLVAIVNLFSRHVLSWKLSNSLYTELCLDALEMALWGSRKPEIFHSDQGHQFTSCGFVARLQAEEIKTSRSGWQRCYDSILVERLWRTVTYVAAGFSAKPSRGLPACLQRWLGSCNQAGPIPVEVLLCKTTQLLGRQNSP